MSEDKTGNQSSIGVLQEKIRNQAKRLCSFQEYISICEKRLLQYNPNENLPLNKHSLKKPVQVNQQDLQKKYNDLMIKYNSLYESVARNNISRNTKKSSESKTIKSFDGESYEEIITLYNKLQSENAKLLEEKETMMETIKKEMVTNDEQRNYIEILKQAIESSLIKTGLKTKIDLLKKKYYTNTPKDEYASVLLDISNMKEKNDELTNINEKLKNDFNKVDKELNEIKDSFNKQKEDFEKVQVDYENIKNEKENIESAHIEIKNQFEQQDFEFKKLSVDFEKLSKENSDLVAVNKMFKEENEKIKLNNLYLNQNLSDLQLQFENISNINRRLQNVENDYSNISKENLDIKKINQRLSHENNSYQQEIESLKSQIRQFTQIKEENMSISDELYNLRNQIAVLRNEKNKNETFFLSKIEALTQEKNVLENIIYKKELQDHKNKEDQIELNTYRNELMKMKELTMKYENENKFYTNIIYRIIKFHIQNLNVRNIILEILNLNEKSTIISQELEKTNYTNDETGRNKFYFTKGQLNELGQKLDLLENELKQYEI